ncbi:unnamed protein product [Candidula unifasciata]|uniref:Uncharacterized protein n=1 Tax=Candidula unifasciata TaxID=100452 RepID=A0A8S3Z5S3_9EUPU|nr:unnamed protein product [Candidula unifasciata]
MTDHNRMCEPTLPTISPTCSLTVYLQQQYPDYFQDVFGIPASFVSENTPSIDLLTGQSEAADCCPKPADQCHVTGMCSSTQGSGVAENTNANSLCCGQQVPMLSATAPQQKSLKVNVCRKGHGNVSKETSRTRHPLLTCVTEAAVADLCSKMELWLGKLKTDIQVGRFTGRCMYR